MLVEVPTKLTRPPTRAPNDIGMSSREGEVPVRAASLSAMGIMIAKAPTFLVTMASAVVATARTGA